MQLGGYLPGILTVEFVGEGPVGSEGALPHLSVSGELADGLIGEVESGSARSVIAECEQAVLIVGAPRGAANYDLVVIFLTRFFVVVTELENMVFQIWVTLSDATQTGP